MRVSIICVGKIKEKFYTDAIAEYKKRLSRFCDFEIVEIPDLSIPDNASEAEKEQIKNREGEKILDKLKGNTFTVALCIEGKTLSSEDLAKTMAGATQTTSNISFVIGGSLGLSDTVKSKANLMLSFGRMTLPHQLMRVVLTEQIYRSFMINANTGYHK